MFLVERAGIPFGIGCLRSANSPIAEVKRMYVEPAGRRFGAGAGILGALIEHARRSRCEFVRLDSPRFMTSAHALYRKHGFAEIAPYMESEIPVEFHAYMLFMERKL